MAFRHGNHGQVPGAQRGAIWTCPTCGTENAGPLESGCTKCRAGADAQKARVEVSPQRAAPTGLEGALDRWLLDTYPLGLDTAGYVIAEKAFIAGAAWKEKEMLAVLHQDLSLRIPSPLAQREEESGGYTVAIFDQFGGGGQVDTRTHATIIAALQFYVENTLAYGDMPGQLSVTEAKGLIAQLLPKEEVPQV